MALFKIYRGKANKLADAPKRDGYAYYTTDDSKMYIGVSSTSDETAANLIPLNGTFYGTCSTGVTASAKQVTCANFNTLISGVTIQIQFTYGNTATSPTLKVGTTAAKTIIAPFYNWRAGAILSFTYNGTYWVLNSAAPSISSTIIKTWEET